MGRQVPEPALYDACVFALTLGDGAELRPLEPWQADEFASHLDQVRDHLLPWIPFASRIYNVEGARELLQRFADLQAKDEGRFYGIWIDGVLSGGTLFRTFDVPSGVCEVGVWLAPGAEGRGLVTRAVTHMIDWAFRVRGMARVEWHADPKNIRSAAVARRLGMTREGVLRSSFVLGGARHDTEIWAILSSEWPS
jgi:ribosomal-protein-serine acetyltransferase